MLKIFSSFLLLVISFNSYSQNDGHHIDIHVKGYSDSVAYLANYYAGKQYITDTVEIDNNGHYIFKGEDQKPGGIYMFVNSNKNILFKFVIDEQNFALSTDTVEYTHNMKVIRSPENTIFFDYWKYMEKKFRDAAPLKKKKELCQKSESKTAECLQIDADLEKLNNEVKGFQEKFKKEHPNAMVTKVLAMTEDIAIPDSLNGKDSLRFEFYKEHYFDNIDFQDKRMVRTPVLHDKLIRYMEKMIVPTPDNIITELDMIIGKSEGCYEMYKYLVSQFTYKYESSEQMCIDKVFVHLVDKHFTTGKADWTNSVQKAKIKNRADDLRPCGCGKVAQNLLMKDKNNQVKELHAIKAKYTVMFFWDSGCGHCKKTTPKLKKFYEDYKDLGVEVYGVNIEQESKEYIEYIEENELKWINVQDLENLTHFRNYYDIFSTPVIYLLDENKEIIGKRIDVKNLAIIIDRELGVFDEKKDYEQYASPKSEKHGDAASETEH